MIIDENIQHYLECNDCGGPAIVVILRSTNGYPILRSWSFCLTSCHIIAKFSTPRRTNLLMFNHTLFLKSLTFLTSILAATDLFWLKTMNLKFESRNEIGEIVLIQKILPKTFSTIRSSSRTTAALQLLIINMAHVWRRDEKEVLARYQDLIKVNMISVIDLVLGALKIAVQCWRPPKARTCPKKCRRFI